MGAALPVGVGVLGGQLGMGVKEADANGVGALVAETQPFVAMDSYRIGVPVQLLMMSMLPWQLPVTLPHVHAEQPRVSVTPDDVESDTGNAPGHVESPSTQMQRRSPVPRVGAHTDDAPHDVGVPKPQPRCAPAYVTGGTVVDGVAVQVALPDIADEPTIHCDEPRPLIDWQAPLATVATSVPSVTQPPDEFRSCAAPQVNEPGPGGSQVQPHVALAAVSPLCAVNAVAGALPGHAGAAALPGPETRTTGPFQPPGAAGTHSRPLSQAGPASLPASSAAASTPASGVEPVSGVGPVSGTGPVSGSGPASSPESRPPSPVAASVPPTCLREGESTSEQPASDATTTSAADHQSACMRIRTSPRS